MKRRGFLKFFVISYIAFFTSISFLWATPTEAAQKINTVVMSDIQGHWAQTAIMKWTTRGYISGYPDGTFGPDKNITRAEFIALVNRTFSYNQQKTTQFKDVSKKDWFAGEMAKAHNIGYLSGYPDGTVKPNNQITRQEVAAILGKILALENIPQDYLRKYKDYASIPEWNKAVTNAVVSKGYMSGYLDGTFKPEKAVTRAEAVTILDRVAGTVYNKTGTYGSSEETLTVDGNLTISTGGVTVKNHIVNGDLYLTEGIDEGDITFDNVQLKGTLRVCNRGGDSIYFINSGINNALVRGLAQNKVHLVAQQNTTFDAMEARSSVTLEEMELSGAGFNNLLVNAPQKAEVELIGDFERIIIESPKVNLNIQRGFIESLTISPEAMNTVVNLVAAYVSLEDLTIEASTTVKGKGMINYIYVSAKSVNSALAPYYLTVAPGITAKVGGKTYDTGSYVVRATEGSIGDKNPPAWRYGYPRVARIQTTKVDLYVKANEKGKAYYIVTPKEAKAPSSALVKAGKNGSSRVVAENLSGKIDFRQDEEVKVTIKGLLPSTDYAVYVVLEDKAGNLAKAAEKVVLTTGEGNPYPPAPTGLTGVRPTTAKNNDGKITGVNDTMEYKLSTNNKWIAVKTGKSEIAGLVPGIYEIRVKEEANIPAGKIETVMIIDYEESDDATLSDLKVNGQTVAGFNPATTTYTIEVPYGTKPGDKAVQVTASKHNSKASNPVITQASELPGVCTVGITAEDGITTQTYTINFALAADTVKVITGFAFAGLTPEVQGVINEEAKTITLTVPDGTALTTLVPEITYMGASIVPASEEAQDFTKPVVYTVTAENGTTVDYIVRVTVA